MTVKIFPRAGPVQQNHENDCPPVGDARQGNISRYFGLSAGERQKAAALKARTGRDGEIREIFL